MEDIDIAYTNKYSLYAKQGVYTVCFVLLCVIDLLMGSAVGNIQMTAANCTGLILGVITLTGYRWKDFLQVPYILWALAGGYATYQAIIWGWANKTYKGQWITAVLVVYLYGFIVIRLLHRLIAEKKYPKMNWPYFIFWGVMMLGMSISKSDAVWPILFFVCFGCFYLTDFSKEEKSALFDGAMNGIIIGFLIIQGFATMFRAYDETRYVGMYTNSVMNSLFYFMVHTAILCKWYKFKKTGAAVGWRIFAAVGSCILFGYGMLTIGKTVVISMIINMALFVIATQLMSKRRKMVWVRISSRLVGMLMACVFLLPVVFDLCRYIPAHFYSPLTHFVENELEYKIHKSVNFYDSKYMTWARFKDEAFLFPHSKKDSEKENSVVSEQTGKREWGTGESDDMPVLIYPEDWENSRLVQWAIYRTFLTKTNLVGHSEAEQGVWISPKYFATDARNVFLQMIYSHGILLGLLFLVYVFFLPVFFGKKILQEEDHFWGFGAAALFMLAFIEFASFEMAWKLGQLAFFMIFFVGYLVMRKEENEVVEEWFDE